MHCLSIEDSCGVNATSAEDQLVWACKLGGALWLSVKLDGDSQETMTVGR